MTADNIFVDIGINLHLREWSGSGRPFVLLHGLSSNSRTWDTVAGKLAATGHRVLAVDQRGHGLSDKPDTGYDFVTITADLAKLIQTLDLQNPILVGQSWGGNVLLEFGARYPQVACSLGFIDGGFLDLQSRPERTWEKVAAELRPPDLLGTPRSKMKQRIQDNHPDWTEAGIEATLHNFETLPDGTIRPWLDLNRHMAILRAMWTQRPQSLYSKVKVPVLICVAASAKTPDWNARKARQVATAEAELAQCQVQWFDNTDHDIHVHRPDALADLLLDMLNNGIWQACA